MTLRIPFVIIFSFLFLNITYAQSTKKKLYSNNGSSDYIAFHRQIIGLKEYTDERNKIPLLQKTCKSTVKVKAFVDTTNIIVNSNTDADETDEDNKVNKLIGFIAEDLGDISINVYQITYSCNKKKITAVIPINDTIENEKINKGVTDKKLNIKKPVLKKENDDEEDDEDKPVKKKEIEKNKDSDDD